MHSLSLPSQKHHNLLYQPVLTSSSVCLQSISARRVAKVLAVSSAFFVPFSLVGAITKMINLASWLLRPKLAGYLSLAIATYLFCTDGNEHLGRKKVMIKFRWNMIIRDNTKYGRRQGKGKQVLVAIYPQVFLF